MKKSHLVVLIILIIGTFSFTLNKQIKSELLTIYQFDNNNKIFLKDSIYKYYINDKLVKTISPAFKSHMGEKFATITSNTEYDTNGDVIKKYTHQFYPKDSEPTNYIQDSVSYKYNNKRLVLITDYTNKIENKPKQTVFEYKNEKLYAVYENNQISDSISFNYPTKNTIEKNYFTRGELCYNEKTTIISEKDTLISINVNRSSKYCGYNTNYSIRKIYSSENKLELEILKKENSPTIYSYYVNGNLIKKCNDSLQKYCDTKYEYEYDKNNNWIKKIEKINEKVVEIQKRKINY